MLLHVSNRKHFPLIPPPLPIPQTFYPWIAARISRTSWKSKSASSLPEVLYFHSMWVAVPFTFRFASFRFVLFRLVPFRFVSFISETTNCFAFGHYKIQFRLTYHVPLHSGGAFYFVSFRSVDIIPLTFTSRPASKALRNSPISMFRLTYSNSLRPHVPFRSRRVCFVSRGQCVCPVSPRGYVPFHSDDIGVLFSSQYWFKVIEK